MITIKEFMELIEHRINEGYDWKWNCFGQDVFSLNSYTKGYHITITFSTIDQTVYMVETSDYQNNRAYRLINPNHIQAYKNECSERDVDDVAWDNVKWIDLETKADWMQKTKAVILGEQYDTRVELPIDIDDGLLFELMWRAHEEDITLNHLVEKILTKMIAEQAQTSV